ncbi:universal stress protein [Halalkalicoccus sp. NIPERK01]|uniref:universal stress protein n=1 Tax=Halalkalicoccus sp. NIPERK01 TaxID=3053469 RepID=UPI00256EAE7F|nr:universal stress protein [Halalkalicoccus sp. NIPERK01]MDL5362303.1 universal stress protein [Halalkalicoccus sp. NIPERK01]
MYERILLPVAEDASPDERYGPVYDLAKRTGATVAVLSVADTGRDSVTNLGGEVVDTLEREATDAVERFAEHARERSIPVETEVVQGVPHEKIVAYADARDVDLIVVRKRDRGRLREALLGSVTDRVIRLSEKPVLVL